MRLVTLDELITDLRHGPSPEDRAEILRRLDSLPGWQGNTVRIFRSPVIWHGQTENLILTRTPEGLVANFAPPESPYLTDYAGEPDWRTDDEPLDCMSCGSVVPIGGDCYHCDTQAVS